MVFGALALLSFVTMEMFQVSRAAAPKGTKSCRIQGESVHQYVRLSMGSEAGLGLLETSLRLTRRDNPVM